MTATAIAISGLVKTFGPTRTLDGLDLTVNTGEVHGFLGPTAPGRPHLAGPAGPAACDAGTVRLRGGDPWRDATRLHRRFATCRRGQPVAEPVGRREPLHPPVDRDVI